MRSRARKAAAAESGTIVDATIISAPSSTKNETKNRDPEMQQAKKHGQWYFAMKVHICASKQGFVHSRNGTSRRGGHYNAR